MAQPRGLSAQLDAVIALAPLPVPLLVAHSGGGPVFSVGRSGSHASMGTEWSDIPTVGDAELELPGRSRTVAVDGGGAGERSREGERSDRHVGRQAPRRGSGGEREGGPGELRFNLTSLGVDAGIAGAAGLHKAGERAAVITPYRDGPLLVRGPFRLRRPGRRARSRSTARRSRCAAAASRGCGRSATARTS